MTIRFLLQKEFLQIRRNAFLPRLIILFPIVIMCVIPWVMNMEVKNVIVEVVDNDRTTRSQQLVHTIEVSRYFHFNGQKNSYDEALQSIQRGKADIALVIPRGYSQSIAAAETPQVMVAANAVNGTKGSMGSAYFTQIVTASVQPDIAAMKKSINTLVLYNKNQNYKRYMIPALLALVMMLMTGFLPTLNIVSEKEAGTIEQMNVTPVSKWTFILAKLIPYWIIAFFVATVCLVLAWLLYDITCTGSLVWVYLLAMLLALFISSFGLTISNYSDTMQQAIFVMWFFIVCMLLLSGLFTPARSMPDWAYMSTYINPMHYFIDAVRTVFLRGGGWRDIAHQIAALASLGFAMAAAAVASYKKNS